MFSIYLFSRTASVSIVLPFTLLAMLIHVVSSLDNHQSLKKDKDAEGTEYYQATSTEEWDRAVFGLSPLPRHPLSMLASSKRVVHDQKSVSVSSVSSPSLIQALFRSSPIDLTSADLELLASQLSKYKAFLLLTPTPRTIGFTTVSVSTVLQAIGRVGGWSRTMTDESFCNILGGFAHAVAILRFSTKPLPAPTINNDHKAVENGTKVDDDEPSAQVVTVHKAVPFCEVTVSDEVSDSLIGSDSSSTEIKQQVSSGGIREPFKVDFKTAAKETALSKDVSPNPGKGVKDQMNVPKRSAFKPRLNMGTTSGVSQAIEVGTGEGIGQQETTPRTNEEVERTSEGTVRRKLINPFCTTPFAFENYLQPLYTSESIKEREPRPDSLRCFDGASSSNGQGQVNP